MFVVLGTGRRDTVRPYSICTQVNASARRSRHRGIEPCRRDSGVKVWVTRLWRDGRALPRLERKPSTPGKFEIEHRVARLLGGTRGTANPNLIPELHQPEVVKLSGTCMRLRGWERPETRVVLFQEWIVDTHSDGYGKFADE
jgi:hypothetical protein